MLIAFTSGALPLSMQKTCSCCFHQHRTAVPGTAKRLHHMITSGRSQINLSTLLDAPAGTAWRQLEIPWRCGKQLSSL